jgi:cytochrome c peroxidase
MQDEQQQQGGGEQGSYWSRKLTHNGKPWMGPDQYEETGGSSGGGGGSSNSNGGIASTSSSTTGSSSGGGGGGGQLCRLPSDMVLLYDPEFKKWIELYARDRNRFFIDFAKAFSKLLELGVPFAPQKPWWKRWFLFFL